MKATSLVICLFSLTAVLSDVPDQTSSEIVGGHEVRIEKHPYIVGIIKTAYIIFSKQICGATIIKENFILTAGHCVEEDSHKPQSYSICAGQTEREKCLQKRTVQKIYIHENYDTNTLLNDIALLELQDPLEFGNTIKPITLANKRHVLVANDVVIASGWGKTEDGSPSENLKSVNLKVFSHEKCKSQYDTYNVTDNMICAGGKKGGGKDTCQGDSGGPLVYNGILVGVTSWGDGCGQPGVPGIYTSVSKYRKWIRNIANV